MAVHTKITIPSIRVTAHDEKPKPNRKPPLAMIIVGLFWVIMSIAWGQMPAMTADHLIMRHGHVNTYLILANIWWAAAMISNRMDTK